MFRVIGSIVGLLVLAVLLPKLGDFLALKGWPVQAAMDVARQLVDVVIRELSAFIARI